MIQNTENRKILKFGVCHCERSEAISNATMAYSAYNAGDCHGPSGLAMTDRGAFRQNTI